MSRRKSGTPGVGTDEPKPKVTRESLRDAIQIFRFVRPYRLQVIVGMLLLFLGSLVFMVFPLLAGEMVDVAQGNSEWPLTLPQMGITLLGILLVQGAFSYACVLLFAQVSERGIADVRKSVYERLITLPIAFFEKSRVGELISRVTSDIERLYNAFSITLAEFVRQIIILISGVIFLAISTPRLALIMLATFPIIVVGAMIFGRHIRKLSKERQNALADTNTVLNETLTSVHSVKAFTNEWFELSRYSRGIDAMVLVALRFARGRAIFAVFIITVLFGALFFIIWQGALMVQSGRITAGDLIAFVSYTAIIGGAIAGLGNFYTELIGAVGATERIREILATAQELEVSPGGAGPSLALRGNIEFRDVHFEYPTRPDLPVLKGLNFTIQAGEKVALVGPSGAGKSTVVQLLLRLYDLQSGKLLVDGEPASDYDLSAYRRNFALVPQEVMLFGGTIRENILYGRGDATDEEIIEAARQANALEFIEEFPDGFGTIVGERGVKLSGGQRQRIAIARAILRDPAILLLDEATSSLDAESERVVQDALDKLLQGRTALIIAHRLSTIRDADRILVIDKGRLVEEGRHDELFANEDGLYHHLARLQFEEKV